MKKILFLFSFIFCGLLTVYHFHYRIQKKENIDKHLISSESELITEKTSADNKEMLTISITETILLLIIFFIVNYFFKLYDKKTDSITITTYKYMISENFRYLALGIFSEPLKYFIYQQNCNFTTVLKSSGANVLKLGFYHLLVSFFEGFSKTLKKSKNRLKNSFKNAIHDNLLYGYYDLFYGLYQNYNLKKICRINNNVNLFCESLSKRNIPEKEIKELKKNLAVEIVEHKKNTNNYFFLSLLTCTSSFLFAREEGALYNYLASFVRRNCLLSDFFDIIKEHQKMKIIRKKLLVYKEYIDDFELVEESINKKNNSIVIRLILMVFARAFFSKSNGFISFFAELISEMFLLFFSSALFNGLGTISDAVGQVKNDDFVNGLMSMSNGSLPSLF